MSYRNNRPAPQSSEPESAPAPAPRAEPVQRAKRAEPPKRSKKPLQIVLAIAVVGLLAFVAWFFLGRTGNTAAAIDTSKYQAVFFTNGQVYFGKLSTLNDDYMRLKSVYYLQNKKQSSDDASPQAASEADASDVELIKLGSEIHGPEDEMLVAKDQVLFFENLKPTGTVSKTITDFQKKQ